MELSCRTVTFQRPVVSFVVLLLLWIWHHQYHDYVTGYPLDHRSSRRCCTNHHFAFSSIPLSITTPTTSNRRRNALPTKTTTTTTAATMSATKSSNTYEKDQNGGNQPRRKKFPIPNPRNVATFLIQQFKVLRSQIQDIQLKYITRFKSLSRRSKMIIMIQCIVLLGGFSSSVIHRVTNHNHYNHQYRNAPPIEISYSSFLDIIEQKAVGFNTNTGNNNNNINMNYDDAAIIPKIDQVRIGSDRIVYRLYNSNSNNNNNNLSPSSTTTTSPATTEVPSTAVTTTKRRLFTISQRSKKQRKVVSTPSYIQAYTKKVSATPELIHQLRSHDISFAAASVPRTTSLLAVAARTILVGFYFIILFRLYRTISGSGIGGGPNKNDAVGKLAKRNTSSDLPLATFDEIQGIDTAKIEVMELVDVLRNPDKYAILGARAPTGLLLVGPPGTGKTMLARATAATAGVPLLYCSGSDFVEMFVGRGAARVRQLFDRATKLAPCIIFIDELDALGKSRDFGGNGFGGGGLMSRSNDEAEQTLNQLLACMDGLDSSRQVCVLAATNRKEVLDPALIRPGRFDRIVKLELPNAYGREQILRVHASKLPGFIEGSGLDVDRTNALGKGRMVDLSAIASVTDGWSGAELEFLVNEAAIRAVRRVSAALQRGTTPLDDIVPHVEARDFEESLRSFYETRKPRGSGTSAVNDLLKNVWK